jgi:type I restriction enzyme M protein
MTVAVADTEEGTPQNRLRDDDLARILDAYDERADIDKYAYCATLAEIEENDFNLHISRYVDTFEEDELIDIGEVQRDIDVLKGQLASLVEQMQGYLRELGLDG